MPETDYTGNSKKEKEAKNKPEKTVEKVVTGDVMVQKRSLGRKMKDLFIEADFRSVSHYILSDIMLPAFKNLIVDGVTKGVERTIYGEPAMRRRSFSQGPRVSYNNPIGRTPRDTEPRRYGAPRCRKERHIVQVRTSSWLLEKTPRWFLSG